MIIVDANILLYAYNRASEHHSRAARWVERTFSDAEPVRLPWQVIHAFLRLTTQAGLLPKPFNADEAASIVTEWLEQPSVGAVDPGARYWTILRKLLIQGRIRGAMVMDAHLAALTIEHAGTLYTTDKDFSRFDELRVVNPIA